MRRKVPDYSYKERTRTIVDQRFEPWQLAYRDAREGIHRFLNRTVSLMQELDNEAEYVENMFFPEQMDLSEEWVLYRPYPNQSMNNVYLSGQQIDEIVTPVANLDEMLAGGIDILDPQFVISGIPFVESLLAVDIQHTYILGSGIVTEVDLQNTKVVSSGEIDTVLMVDEVFYADIEHLMYPLKQYHRDGTLTVMVSGVAVPFTLYDNDELTGNWNEEFDADGDGIIGTYERAALETSYGLNQQNVSPSVWENIDWLDVNKDGYISDVDYNAVIQSIPSAAPDVKSVIEVPFGVNGALDIRYEQKLPKAKHLFRNRNEYDVLDDFHKLYQFATKVAYDSHTDVYLGINTDRNELRAYRYDTVNDEVVSDLLIYVPRWSSSCTLVDIDIVDGLAYVLVTDGTISRVYYGDIWRETVEEISDYAAIPTMSGIIPSSFTAMPDGYFGITEGENLHVFKGSRDRVIEIEGVTYFNRRHPVTESDGTSLKTIPHYIFNNWDSFAYSLGINRPWGCNNLALKKLIMDFWDHPQGNDKIGINNGMMRELGYITPDIIPSGLFYDMPSDLTYSGEPDSKLWNVTVNSTPMMVYELSGEVGEYLLLSGSIGTIRVEGGNRIFPDKVITLAYDTVTIQGYFLDGNGDPIQMTYQMEVLKGSTTPTINVRTYGDDEFLEEIGWLNTSGEPSDDMITFVKDAIEDDPFIYDNALTDCTPMDGIRLSEDPILPTIYDPNISGLLAGLTEVEIEQ